MSGKNAAFAYFGTAGKNHVWSWSARSADGTRIAITIWDDQLTRGPNGRLTYTSIATPDNNKWLHRPGNAERLKNLIHAQEKCEGKFYVVRAVAVDPNAQPRKIASCYPDTRMIGHITSLNRSTGEFTAELEMLPHQIPPFH